MNEFMSSYDRSPQGLKMICFWAKVQNLRYLRYSFWIKKFLSFRKVENFVNYKVSSYIGDAAKKSSTDIRGRKFYSVLWITPLTGGENISIFFIFLVLSPNYDFGIQMTKNLPSFSQPGWTKVFLWPGLDESELVAFSIDPLILTNRAARGF